MKYEYDSFHAVVWEDVMGRLNTLGSDGWRLAKVLNTSGNFYQVIVERAVPVSVNPLLGA